MWEENELVCSVRRGSRPMHTPWSHRAFLPTPGLPIFDVLHHVTHPCSSNWHASPFQRRRGAISCCTPLVGEKRDGVSKDDQDRAGLLLTWHGGAPSKSACSTMSPISLASRCESQSQRREGMMMESGGLVVDTAYGREGWSGKVGIRIRIRRTNLACNCDL
ncbi:hypothetical protein B0H34DRAFT_539426 [Crassisporium funariophilum]|nr:hypothetical protein B0H34DRAFT_539426 [Crassisporium funariophilum]